jgi:NADH-quinone oxidoreductase subunit M
VELIIFTLPLILACLVFVVPQNLVRGFGILGSLAVVGLVASLFCGYDPTKGILYFIKQPWLENYGITLHFGFDSIALIMLLLAAALVFLILLSNYQRDLAKNRAFTSMVFLMLFGLFGVFTALDGLWFYIFWEITLIPIFLICWWFGAKDRKPALIKFFIYTFVGSLAMLAALIGIKQMAVSFEYFDLIKVQFNSACKACWMLGGFFLAFAIKIPIFPFHTWQADTYEKSPMAGTMLLSGIMLKMALYGMLRWMLPLFPEALDCAKNPIIILAVIGVVYGAIIAIKQNNMKRLFAYASLSHVGLIAAGIMTLSVDAMTGSILQMVNHGLVAVGLFLAADVIERRTGTLDLTKLGGIAKPAPKFGFWFAALAFASVSVPFTSGFIGEFLLLKGLYDYQAVIGIVAGTTLILGAVYTFRAYQASMFGPVQVGNFPDLHWSELIVFAVILIAVVVLGVYPKAVIDFVEPSVTQLLTVITNPSI